MSQTDNNHPTDELNDKLKSAGRPAVTDKRDQDTDPAHIAGYKCPFCDYTAPAERPVRAHITEVDDGHHRDRNGFLDQIFVHAIDDDGTLLEDVHTDYSETDRTNGEVTVEMFPAGVTEKQRKILEICVQNPGLTNMAVCDRVAERFGYDPSDGYVSKVRRKYLKQTPGADKPADAPTADYGGLTDKQQAVIDEVIEFDDPLEPGEWPVTQTEVAERAGVVMSYIRLVIDNYDTLIEHRKARLESKAMRAGPTQSTTDSKADSKPEPEPEPEPAPDPSTVPVDRAQMRRFATELDALKRSARSQHDASPHDSPMRAHAAGKLELIDRCEGFLKTIANDGGES